MKMSVKVEEKGDGIFIPRELLDELEIESVAKKLRGIVKTRLSVEELEELYHAGV
jgi:hypothetical protein